MSRPPSDPDQPPLRIAYERRLLSPGAEWVALFRSDDDPCGYSVNLRPTARSLVLGRHPELDRGVVHVRLELHWGVAEARAAGRTARAHFDALGYPRTTVRVQGVEIAEADADVAGSRPPLAAVAMLAVVRDAEERLAEVAALPWVTRLDRRGEARHSVVGLTHELYLLLAEVLDCLCPWDDGQIQQWRFGPGNSSVFSAGPVTVARQSPGYLRLHVDRLRLAEDDAWARARFAEFLAALRCHPAVWNVSVSVGPGEARGGVEAKTLVAAGFEEIDSEETTNGEVRQWLLSVTHTLAEH